MHKLHVMSQKLLLLLHVDYIINNEWRYSDILYILHTHHPDCYITSFIIIVAFTFLSRLKKMFCMDFLV